VTAVKILKGIARSKGTVEGEALVSSDAISFLFINVENNTGIIRMLNHKLNGISISNRILVYPTAIGSTAGSIGLFFKTKIMKVGPKAIICQKLHPIDIAGALAAEIPAVDGFDEDPLKEIKTGDIVEVIAKKLGEEAAVRITRKE
jgi:predicted aconitase with swiveling domain